VEITASLIGLFYCIASYIAGRAIFQSIFLEGALQAINEFQVNENTGKSPVSKKPKPQWASIWWVDSTMIIGLGGISALVQWNWAPAFFVWGSLWQALYLYWFAPAFWDDPETFDLNGRQQSKRAFYMYLFATVFIYYCGQENVLSSWGDLSWVQQVLLIGLSVTGGYWFISNAWRMREMLTGKLMRESDSDTMLGQGRDDAVDPLETDTELGTNSEPLIPEKIIVQLIEGEGFFFNAHSGQALVDPFILLGLPFSVEQLFESWMDQWVELRDPTDPYRNRLNGTDAQKQSVNATGQKAYIALQTYLATEAMAGNFNTILRPECFTLAPFNEPQLPKVEPARIKLMLEFLSYPLWHDFSGESQLNGDTDLVQVGCFSADECGLSWQLSRDIEQWAEDFNDSWDYSDPAKGSSWDEEATNKANQRGLAFVEKIKSELMATKRGHIPVRLEKLRLP
jgi:hypothetical protein